MKPSLPMEMVEVDYLALQHLYLCLRYKSDPLCLQMSLLMSHQGVAGLSARDIKLIVDGGFNTIESVAYTYETLH